VKYEASTSTGAKLAGAGTATGSTRAAQFSTKLSWTVDGKLDGTHDGIDGLYVSTGAYKTVDGK